MPKGTPRRYRPARKDRDTPRPWSALERVAYLRSVRKVSVKAYRRFRREKWKAATEHAGGLFAVFILPMLVIFQMVTRVVPVFAMAEGEGFPHQGATGGGSNAQTPTTGGTAGLTGIRDWFDYVADFAGSASGVDQTAKINAAAVTLSGLTPGGAVLFFPPGQYTVNAPVVVQANVQLRGTGWSEGQTNSIIKGGIAMVNVVQLTGNGSSLQEIGVSDPSPFVTSALVRVDGNACSIIDSWLNLAAGALMTVDQRGERFNGRGGRWVGSGVGSITYRQAASDCFLSEVRMIGSRSIYHQSGLNCQYTALHCTGGTNTVENILVEAGEMICTNVQTDAANDASISIASVRVIPVNNEAPAFFYATGCHFLSAQLTANTTGMVQTHSGTGSGQAVAMLDGCSSRANSGSVNYGWIVSKTQALDVVTVHGGLYRDCDEFYDQANLAPDAIGGNVAITTGTPAVITPWGPINGRKTAVQNKDNSGGTGTTLANVTAMGFVVRATDKWKFEFVIFYDSTTTADIKFAITCPAGGTLEWSGGANTTASGTTYVSLGSTVSGTAQAFGGTGSGTQQHIVIEGTYIGGGTAGTLQLQFAQNTGDATVNSTNIQAQSTFRAERLLV